MAEDADDKTFEPSQQKLDKAAAEGNIPNLSELNTAVMYLGGWLSLVVLAGHLMRQWIQAASQIIAGEGWQGAMMQDAAYRIVGYSAVISMALLTVPAICILGALVVGRRLVFSSRKLAPDINRINPVKTAGQKFGGAGLMTFAISLAKALAVLAAGYYLFAGLWRGLVASQAGGSRWPADLGWLLSRILLVAMVTSIVFALIDTFWKKYDHRRKLMMSRQEVQDEHKESEGDPHMKAARRQRAVEIATKQMLADVGKADVIIVNPTHFAVALQWQRGSGRAPVCLAKGVDEVAARIRERARKHKVPIWSDPPCARALHASVEIGQEIRREQFAAVAAAIRFAETMRKKARAGW
jgi:flagellar biosynthetic protein FlhB